MTIAIYSRKSRFTGKGESIANQIELCRREALRYMDKKNAGTGAEILIYEDEGFSGKNTARPQFQKMMAAVRAGEVRCVICYKLDRISRNVGDFARTYEDFERYGVDFLCVNEKYDTTTPAGRAMMGMVSVFAQLERETAAERIRDNMHMLARAGRWLGGHTPTGFQSKKEERPDIAGKKRSAYKLVPIPKEMELVKFIYQKFLETMSVSGTMRYLVSHSISTKNGKDFTAAAVKDILRNPVYCAAEKEAGDYFEQKGAEICYEQSELDANSGFMPYNRTSSGKTRQVRNEISDWLIAVGKHEGIIPAEEWVKVQRILDAKREKNRSSVRTPYKSEALLSGLLVCGGCGGAMRPHVHTGRKTMDGRAPYYYICELKERSAKKRCDMRNVNGFVLDAAVMEELLRYEQEDSAVYQSLMELRGRLAGHKDREPRQQGLLEAELESKQRQMRHLIDTLGTGASDDAFGEQVRKKVNELAKQCDQLKMELQKAAPGMEIIAVYESRAEDIKNALGKLKDTVLTASAVEKRELLKSTVERVVWDGEQANIYLLGESFRL